MLTPEQEIAYGPACWLWDYLRRSGLGGFFLTLRGGTDSSSVAAIVGSMCQLVMKELGESNDQVCWIPFLPSFIINIYYYHHHHDYSTITTNNRTVR